jgi:hypothetical protein
MGYDVHITRAGHWTDSESRPIRREEWLAFVACDPELTLETEHQHSFDPFVLWHAGGEERAWFGWWRGEIRTKYPDRDTIRKMLEIAAHFGAKVQGDDGEVYPTADHWPDRGVHE